MRKIIFMAVAGYLWKKFKANRAAAPVSGTTTRPFPATASTRSTRTNDFS